MKNTEVIDYNVYAITSIFIRGEMFILCLRNVDIQLQEFIYVVPVVVKDNLNSRVLQNRNLL